MPPVITSAVGIPETRRACGNCGHLGHLSRTCKSAEKAHLKVGIEVEGYWLSDRFNDLKRRAADAGVDGVTDGSLARHAGYSAYEFRTRPGSLGEAINQLVMLYPDATDEKVGMHVHVSFENSDLSLLATEAFFAYFDAQWRSWAAAWRVPEQHWFYKRLNGQNTYCQKPSIGNMRLTHIASMDRYNQLNFSSMAQHRTLECRLLPMFRDAKIGISAVEKLLTIYETWLVGGKCTEEFLSTCAKKSEFVVKDESARLERDLELPGVEAVSITKELPVYSPHRLPGYSMLHAGTARQQLQRMGVL